ncbi:MAG: DUF5011 domain-containing protein [Firmicutes bacterium]|nr:DUF5011 domain-containing protein [Bacillota bacterium]
MKKKLLILLFLILILILGSYLFYNIKPKITLYGNDVITLKINTSYEEPGYKTTIFNKDITERTIVKSNLNINKLGKYEITYKINYNNKTYEKTRIIKVIDNNKPVISLLGEGILEICPNEKYIETGYIALDKYDGNITDKVIINESENQITYSVENSIGNKYMTARKIIKKDTINPTIKLNGNQLITLYLGNNYEELGYTATDNCDGDLTNNVTITSNLNTKEEGNYRITYTVKDSSGNIESINRFINILTEPKYNEKIIYLTFDDGPSNTTTKILDILKEEDIKATFFVINNYKKYDKVIKRIFDEEHTIGLHSYSHKYNEIYKSEETYFEDLEKINNKIEETIGIKSQIIRFPGGSSNTIAKKELMNKLIKSTKEKGYIYFDWNIASNDTSHISSKRIYNKVISQLEKYKYNTNIILMHDFSNNNKTVKALKEIIKYGKENGYRFEKITERTPQITHKIK